MAETLTDVLVAGYQDIEVATKDFDALVALVDDKEVAIEGVILVTHAVDGRVSVQQTGDHLGRKGAGWGGGVGLAVGLVRAAVAGVGGGGGGRGRSSSASSSIIASSMRSVHDKIGAEPAAGLGGDHRGVRRAQRLGVEQALGGSLLRSVVQSDKAGVEALKDVARRRRWASSARTVRCSRSGPGFGGTIGRTMEKSVADWTIIAGPKAPDGRAERADLSDRRRGVRASRDVRRDDRARRT